jgi:hypothetical protein
MNITVTNIRPLANAGNKRAFVDVTVNAWKINAFAIVQQNGQRPYVSVPQSSWINKSTGKTVHRNLLELPESDLEAIRAKVLEAWKEFKESSAINASTKESKND